MPCYHPLLAIPTGEKTDNGKVKYRIEGNLDPNLAKELYPGSVPVPCGKCIGCRLDYSRSWADRMMLELETAGKGMFVTLTYSNENAHWTQFDPVTDEPMYATVDKRDCQLFMKRLRKRFPDLKIRFYLGAEYGEKTHRPHYHAILFGIGLSDIPDLLPHGTNELGQHYFTSALLSKTWMSGFVLVSDVSWKTCAYVARYVTKKLNGPWSIDYAVRNVFPEFALMSRKPGIGREYLDKHPECLDYSQINLSTPDGGLQIRIPKYFLRTLELTDKERYDKFMQERKEFAEDKMILKLQKTGLSYLDYLEVEEQNKLNSVKALKRSKVD